MPLAALEPEADPGWLLSKRDWPLTLELPFDDPSVEAFKLPIALALEDPDAVAWEELPTSDDAETVSYTHLRAHET